MSLVNRWYISKADTFILTPPLKLMKLHQKTIWTNTSEQSSCLINICKRMWYSLSPHVPIYFSLCFTSRFFESICFLEPLFSSSVTLSDGKFFAALMHKNLCCETSMLYVCVYIATLMALSQKDVKNQKLVYMQCCWHKTKERKNLENEGGAYLPPTCPSLIVTANLVHLISEEKTCPSALSSLAPSPSPHKRQTVEDTRYSTEL